MFNRGEYEKCLSEIDKLREEIDNTVTWHKKAKTVVGDLIRLINKANQMGCKIKQPEAIKLFEKGEYEKSYNNAVKSIEMIEETINKFERSKKMIDEVKSLIQTSNVVIPKGLSSVEDLEKLHKQGRYDEVIAGIEKLRDEIKDRIEKLERIEKLKKKLNEKLRRTKAKVNVDTAKVNSLLEAGDYDKAIECISRAISDVESADTKYRMANHLMNEIKNEIGRDDIDLSEVKTTFEESISLFNEGEYDRAIDLLKKVKNTVSKLIKTSEPDITINFKETVFKLNAWKKTAIEIENRGNAIAKDVEIVFSDDVEVRNLPKIGSIKPKNKKLVEFGLKPKVEGDVPLEITIKYKNNKNEEKSVKQTIWIEVHETVILPHSQPTSITLPTAKTFPLSQTTMLTDFPERLLIKYEPIEVLGEGGFSVVYKCKRKEDGKIVAVKVPKIETPNEAEIIGKSFISEINNWNGLRHINIVELHDYNIFPYPHIEMELCDCTLKDISLTFKEKLRVAYCIADSLSYAHSRGVIHGDLKPSNILIKRIGNRVTPKLTDWGMGYTLAYAPPEVAINGEKPDEKADVWSFGVILYELITGNNPFQGEDDIETMERILDLNPDMSRIGNLRYIVEKCLQKDKEKRYRSMVDVKRDLASLNITYLSSMLSSKDPRLRKNSAVEIVSVYVTSKDFEKAEKRVEFLVRCKFITPKIHEVYRTVFEILKARELSLNDVKMKYNHILNLIPEYRKTLEKDENVGQLLKKIELRIGDVQNKLKDGDEFFDMIKNVFCNRIIDILGEIALSGFS